MMAKERKKRNKNNKKGKSGEKFICIDSEWFFLFKPKLLNLVLKTLFSANKALCAKLLIKIISLNILEFVIQF